MQVFTLSRCSNVTWNVPVAESWIHTPYPLPPEMVLLSNKGFAPPFKPTLALALLTIRFFSNTPKHLPCRTTPPDSPSQIVLPVKIGSASSVTPTPASLLDFTTFLQ